MEQVEREEQIERIKQAVAGFSAQGGYAEKLIQQKRWICWRKEPKGNGTGFTKPPINPATGCKVDIRTPGRKGKGT